MFPRCALPLAFWCVSTSAMAATAEAPNSQIGLHLTDCIIGSTHVLAHCGTYVVYEDRAAASGRKIDVPLVVIPAKRPAHQAIFWNPGGPGAGAVEFAERIADGNLARELMQLHERYDIVLANNRGVGGPAAQQCNLAPRDHAEYYFLQIWPDALLEECRARLAANANLSLYSTMISADDMDDLRAALGYERIVLDGGSYGTYFFLAYMRQHPKHVESAILDGVAPPGLLIIPLQDAAGAQLAMDRLMAACTADATCNKSFPHLAEHFAALVHRFDAGPVRIGIENPATKRPQVVSLSKEVFADRLRQTLYGAASAAYVPYVIERAYLGDYIPLGRMIDNTTQLLAGIVNQGLNLSVTCAEDIPFIDEAAIQRTSAGSFEGDVRVRAQQRACKIWNVSPVPATFSTPVRSTVPVLMVSGSDDPTSPAQFAIQELAYLPNAKRALVLGAGHTEETPCTDRLKVMLVLSGSVRDLDTDSCKSAFQRPPFATSMAGFG